MKVIDFLSMLRRHNYYNMPSYYVERYNKYMNNQEPNDVLSLVSFKYNGLKDVGVESCIVNNRTKDYLGDCILPLELFKYFI